MVWRCGDRFGHTLGNNLTGDSSSGPESFSLGVELGLVDHKRAPDAETPEVIVRAEREQRPYGGHHQRVDDQVMTQHIMVGFDGSSESLEAMRWAAEEASTARASGPHRRLLSDPRRR